MLVSDATVRGAALAGWAAALGLPVIASFVLEVIIYGRIRRLEDARAVMAREWGLGEGEPG